MDSDFGTFSQATVTSEIIPRNLYIESYSNEKPVKHISATNPCFSDCERIETSEQNFPEKGSLINNWHQLYAEVCSSKKVFDSHLSEFSNELIAKVNSRFSLFLKKYRKIALLEGQ